MVVKSTAEDDKQRAELVTSGVKAVAVGVLLLFGAIDVGAAFVGEALVGGVLLMLGNEEGAALVGAVLLV